MKFESVECLIEHGLCETRQSAWQLAREILPLGVVVRIGRRVLINEDRLDAFLEAGGADWPGGWRRERETTGSQPARPVRETS